MHLSGSEHGQILCSCEYGIEFQVPGEFFNYLRNYSFLKTEYAVWM